MNNNDYKFITNKNQDEYAYNIYYILRYIQANIIWLIKFYSIFCYFYSKVKRNVVYYNVINFKIIKLFQ